MLQTGKTHERSRRRARAALATCVLASALALPGSALAGIEIDPDAPAGVQYGAPLDRAREESGGGGGNAGAPGSTDAAPLFGEGVSTADASGSTADGSTGKDAGGADGSTSRANAASADELNTESSSAIPPLLTIALAVVVAGGAGGIALRRAKSRGS